ncbi:MAG: HDOD domain-containing protein [Polyangiaceae bacterium]|nr:HDOD domain-containing protein [Polyangiaceae bacterium]
MRPVDVAIQEDLWFGSSQDDRAEERAAQSMAAKVGRVVGAKPFPEAARRLDELTRGVSCKIGDVVRVLEMDPALSARLLRLVNSSGYALRMRCSSVHHAAVLVGTRRLNQLATTAAVLDMFDSSTRFASRIVEHAAVVGSLCRYLAAHFGLPSDELATSGFLHDIGKLVLLDTEGLAYANLLEVHSNGPDQASLAEREQFGFDHAVLGAHVLSAWHIPEPVPKVVAWHHHPARALQAGGMVAAMVQALRMADAIAHFLVATPKTEAIESLSRSEMASYLEIGEAQLAAMWTDFEGLYFHARARGRDADPEIVPRRVSVEPKSKAPKSPKVPKQFPCVCCGAASFGSTCEACRGYVCAEHWHDREQWCAHCVTSYRTLEHESSIPVGISVTAAATVAAAAGAGAFASGSGAGAAGLVAVGSGAIAAAVVVILHRASRRMRFYRQQADSEVQRKSQTDLLHIEVPSLPALPGIDIASIMPSAPTITEVSVAPAPTPAAARAALTEPPDPVIEAMTAPPPALTEPPDPMIEAMTAPPPALTEPPDPMIEAMTAPPPALTEPPDPMIEAMTAPPPALTERPDPVIEAMTASPIALTEPPDPVIEAMTAPPPMQPPAVDRESPAAFLPTELGPVSAPAIEPEPRALLSEPETNSPLTSGVRCAPAPRLNRCVVGPSRVPDVGTAPTEPPPAWSAVTRSSTPPECVALA